MALVVRNRSPALGLLFVSITVVQVTLTHLMLVRFQHEQLLQEYRHTHEAHIFVAVGSAPTPATNSPSPSWFMAPVLQTGTTLVQIQEGRYCPIGVVVSTSAFQAGNTSPNLV